MEKLSYKEREEIATKLVESIICESSKLNDKELSVSCAVKILRSAITKIEKKAQNGLLEQIL